MVVEEEFMDLMMVLLRDLPVDDIYQAEGRLRQSVVIDNVEAGLRELLDPAPATLDAPLRSSSYARKW